MMKNTSDDSGYRALHAFIEGVQMRTFCAFIAAIALTAVALTGCTTAPQENGRLETIGKTTESSNVTQQSSRKDDPIDQPPGASGPISMNPVNVGNVVWDGFATSGGSSGDQEVIETYTYVIALTSEQLAAYESAGNTLGPAAIQVVEQLCPAAVIDSLRLQQRHPSVDITFTVDLIAS